MAGAYAARNTDASAIRHEIIVLSGEDAKRCGWTLDTTTLEKTHRGVKSDYTARFLLPFKERTEYLEDPAA
jgi:hypothetical protein